MTGLDDPIREQQLQRILARKGALRRFYEETYERFAGCLERAGGEGDALELGSGGGFVKERIPEMITSDVIAYPSVDQVVDATRMPFPDGSLRALCMLNVFHHIPDAAAFLREAERVLARGGRVLIVDQYPSWLSLPIYRHLHHEPFDPKAPRWEFESEGPLSDANGALAWIVFERDREEFRTLFPGLQIVRYQPHSPLRYWLSGGLKSWTLLPGILYGLATTVDRFLAMTSKLCSFVDIELERV